MATNPIFRHTPTPMYFLYRTTMTTCVATTIDRSWLGCSLWEWCGFFRRRRDWDLSTRRSAAVMDFEWKYHEIDEPRWILQTYHYRKENLQSFFLRWSQWWWLEYSVECRGWIGDGKCPIPNCGFWTSSRWSVATDFSSDYSSARWDVLWAHAAGTHHPSQFYFILFPCSDVEGSNDGRRRISSLLSSPWNFRTP